MAWTERELKILEDNGYIEYADRCLYCDYYSSNRSYCMRLDVKVKEYGKCNLYTNK